MHILHSPAPVLTNGDAEGQSKGENDQDVSSELSTQRCSGGAKGSAKLEEPQPLVTLTDVKSMYISYGCFYEVLCTRNL